MRRGPRRSVVVAALAGVALVAMTSAAEAGQIEQPTSTPFVVALDQASHPLPFTVAAAGFAPGRQVFVEQCDGVSPSTANWDPAIDCDSGSSPAPIVASSDGRAVFAAADRNHRFLPFVGLSPQGQFSCLAQGAPSPKGGGAVPAYATCYVRVSSTNAAATSDQVLFVITLPAGATPPPTTPPNAGSATTGPRGATTSTPAGGGVGTATTHPQSGRTTGSTRRAATTSSRALVGAQSVGSGGGRPGSSSSTSSVGGLIGAIVVASGIGGYVWALRRRRAAAVSPR